MYEVVMTINDKDYTYGVYPRDKANEVAIELRKERNVEVNVYEAE